MRAFFSALTFLTPVRVPQSWTGAERGLRAAPPFFPVIGALIGGVAAAVTYGTDAPPEVPPRADGPLRLAVSRTRPPAFVQTMAAELDAELVPMGSAGVKCASVWRGEADAYVHAGGQYEWDSAAPVAVARAAGLFTSRIDGSPLVYNRPDPLLPDLLVCRPEIADLILRTTARHSRRGEEHDD